MEIVSRAMQWWNGFRSQTVAVNKKLNFPRTHNNLCWVSQFSFLSLGCGKSNIIFMFCVSTWSRIKITKHLQNAKLWKLLSWRKRLEKPDFFGCFAKFIYFFIYNLRQQRQWTWKQHEIQIIFKISERETTETTSLELFYCSKKYFTKLS